MKMDVSFALTAGYECLVAWSDLLDRINVFPVADGDTGTNLRISLTPLRDRGDGPHGSRGDQLSRCATGNSGNIAAAFFREFIDASAPDQLADRAARGRDRAWQAVAAPRRGTMLSVFDTVAALLANDDWRTDYPKIRRLLQQSVLDGARYIPEVRQAGVVDAGALAMFIFFDGFCQRLLGTAEIFVAVLNLFAGRLRVADDFRAAANGQWCVDAVLAAPHASAETLQALSALGDSVVLLPGTEQVKIHVHTPEPDRLRERLAGFGDVVDWSGEAIETSGPDWPVTHDSKQVVHILSDAAGSLTRELAGQAGISLLDSYIVADGQSRPESLCDPASIYRLLRAGTKVTTAQASTFERHQSYRRICEQLGRTIYLCVGSAFTGNVETALAWKNEHDPGELLEVVDTGAASGRLGLIALLTARFARTAGSIEQVSAFARRRLSDCREYVFIDELKYLVAGGRVSRAGGFFGDLLHLKPVISPTSAGVRKEGVVRNRKGQLAFALARLSEFFSAADRPTVMLQFTDNADWVKERVGGEIAGLLPRAEVLVVPLSLTSGVHMGPGTWSVACGPAQDEAASGES
jgi:DegV family protein with EDD domain